MKRRTLLISIGGAAGTAGVIGTGAFTSVEADRDVSVSVANENDAYLGIEPSPSASPNSGFATQDSSNANQIALAFDDSGNGGSGVGLSSVYDFDDVFRVTNQGTQTVYVWANFSGGDLSDDDIWFYPDGESDRELNDGTNSVVTVPVGETIKMGVHIDTNVLGSTENEMLTATLTADVDVPGGSTPSDGVGEDAAVVSKNPDQGEYSSIQSAVDDVDGTTVYVEPGVYDESVGIDVEGLNLRGTTDPKSGEAATVVGQSSDTITVQSNNVTVERLKIQNPEGASSDPSDNAGAIGVNVDSGNTGVTVVDNAITEVGTENDDANPMAVYAQGATDGITVENNTVSSLVGTDEDQGALQAIHINSQRAVGGINEGIDEVRVANNDISDLLDTRSTVAVRFNGDVSGEIVGNTISDLNTEGDIPGTNDPGGFTQVLALSQGGNSTTGPTDVTIENNDISNIETTTPENFAPPVHLIVTNSASNVSVSGNNFSADSPDVESFVVDTGGVLDLATVQEGNTFEPSVQESDGVLYPGDLTLVSGGGDELQTAIDNASAGDTLAVDGSTYNAVSVNKSLDIQSIFERPTIEATSSRIEVSASDVRISGFDIDLANGEKVYVNPGEGLEFRNNTVELSSTSPHGIRIDAAGTAETVVSNNEFTLDSSQEDNPQAILFSDGANYTITDNILDGGTSGQGILVSTQGPLTEEFDILNNEISGWETPITLFENPADGDIDNGLIVGNEIESYNGEYAIYAFEQNGDGFDDLNSESEQAAQKAALENDNGGVAAEVIVGGSL